MNRSLETAVGHRIKTGLNRRSFLGAGLAGIAFSGGWISFARAEPGTTLVGVLEEDPPVMNPAITAVVSSYASGSPVYDALTEIHPDGSIHPELAEKWEISPDGLTYVFHLRRGVLWHDGAPFSSADVKFSIENANGKLHPWGRGAFKSVSSVEAPDAATVVLKLKQPQASLISGTDSACGAILPKHIWEKETIATSPFNHKPIGTGPYKFKEYVRGEAIRYVRNEQYYGEKPEIDEVILRIIPDPAARVSAFENGDVDMVYHGAIPFSEAPRLAKMSGVTVKTTDMRGAAYLGIINVEKGPCMKAEVRQALAMAIDRAFIRDNVAPEYALKMVGPLPPASPLVDKTIEDYPFDPKKAEGMLDAAGYPKGANGIRFEFNLLWPNYDQVMTKAADIIFRNLADIGVKVNLTPLERAALNQKGYIGREFDMIMETYGLGPDPDIGVERLYNSNNILTPPVPFTNGSGYRNPEVDRLFDEQRVQLSPEKRREIYNKIQRLIWKDIPVLPVLCYNAPNAFRSSYVTGIFNGSYGNQEDYKSAKLVKK